MSYNRIMLADHDYDNPMWDYMSGFLPRRLKNLLKWCEYLYYRCPQIYTAVTRLADFAVTDIDVESAQPDVKAKYSSAIDLLDVRGLLKTASTDVMVYGNGFYSPSYPVKRLSTCAGCRTQFDLGSLSYTFDMAGLHFSYRCPMCEHANRDALSNIVEQPIYDHKQMTFVCWDPKYMEIEHNPITNTSRYYTTFPDVLRGEMVAGNTWLMSNLPKGVIEAAARGVAFRFAPGAIYHLKTRAPSGVTRAWGLPPSVAVMRPFWQLAQMLRANEAICREYATPMRVVTPTAGMAGGNAVKLISLSRWREEFEQNVKRWRRDPNHIMTAPVGLDVASIGGTARTMMLSTEIEQMENTILAALGVPRELVYGGLSATASSMALRVLENQLAPHTKQLQGLLTWATSTLQAFMSWEPVSIHLRPFRQVDDVALNSLKLQADATYGILSRTAVAKIVGVDLAEMRMQKKQEALDDAKLQLEIDAELAKMRSNPANMLQASGASGVAVSDLEADQSVETRAQSIYQSFQGLDQGTVNSQLEALQTQSAPVYAMVRQLISDASNVAEQQARAQARGVAG